MITLYEGITTTTSPATFTGLPFPLNDAIDCTVTEERNGQFSLVMRYPIGGAYWEKIIPDAIIMATPRPNADPEPFRIYEIEQVIEGVVTARANHIVYDLDGIGPLSIDAITEYWTNLDDFISSVNTDWFQYRNMCFLLVNDGLTSTSSIPHGTGVMQTLWAVIGYIANAFNAELKYEWVNGVCVITFCAARGVQKPTVISYGVNLVALNRKLYTGDLYSSVCAYYNKDDDLTYGWANTPYTARDRILFVNVTDKFNSVPTQEEIYAAAQEYVDSHDFNPLSDLSVEFIPLENTTESESPSVPPLRGASTPYVKRPSGGGLDLGIRNSETDKIIGGTVAWNQRAVIPPSDKSKTQNGVTIVDNRDGSFTVSTDANGATANTYLVTSTYPAIKDHKYFFKSAPIGGSISTFYAYMIGSGIIESKTDLGGGCVQKCLADGIVSVVGLYVKSGAVITTPIKFIPQIFDITAMFGSTIADYIYSLERANAGDGVAWFKNLFNGSYYSYDVGTLESVQTSAHIMRDADDGIVGNYALDPDLVLRGIPKLDANNNLRYDGDVYESNGNVTRKYGIIDLGTLSWTKYSVSQGTLFRSAEINGAKIVADGSAPNIMCQYPSVSQSNRANMTASCLFANKVDIVDNTYANSTAQQFQTAMSGVYLVYELATQTTETADPYTNPQTVDPHGTEQYVDAAYTAGSRDFEMPVGHETIYTFVPDDASLYLCDTATVDASLIGVSATAKCVKVVYNEITGKYDSVTVGTIQTDIVDTILKLGE